MKKIFISFDQYAGMCERLGKAIRRAGRKYDAIVCLARGGMLVGDILSRILKLPLGVMVTSAYKEDGVAGEVLLSDVSITDPSKLKGNILLVDDLLDSGATITAVEKELYKRYDCESVDIGVLWWKHTSEFDPDYWIKYLAEKENGWIVQPFEIFDEG